MKHYSVMLWVAIVISIASCNKNDCIPGKELWQIRTIDRAGGNLTYRYNDQRLLTNITKMPWGFGPNFILTSDAQGRPATLRDSISSTYDKMVYQGGKLVRVDTYSGSNVVTGQTFFTYDNKGRIIKKDGAANANYWTYVTYEYLGNSQNFTKANYYNTPSNARTTLPTDPSVIMEYTYDNKKNPYTTLLNTKVIPFWVSEYVGPTFYDPIVPNNVVNQKFYGKTDTGYFKFQEYDWTYTYENDFPVANTFKRTSFNPDGTPGFVSTTSGTYTYDKFTW